jgi:hypothetical protein
MMLNQITIGASRWIKIGRCPRARKEINNDYFDAYGTHLGKIVSLKFSEQTNF